MSTQSANATGSLRKGTNPWNLGPQDSPPPLPFCRRDKVTLLGHPFDFISNYVDYADVREISRDMHEGTAIQIVGSTLNRRGVFFELGADRYSLDSWMVLLSGSGVGRSALLSAAFPMLDSAGLSGVLRNTAWGSPQAFYQELAEHEHALWVWGELSERLKQFSEPNFVPAKAFWTDCHDNFRKPATIGFRRTGKSSDTPPIIFQHAPRTNVLAGSSEEWFFHYLEITDSAGGFLPRWMILRDQGPKRDVPITPKLDESLGRQLAERLRQISELRGEADLSGIHQLYRDWYGPTKRRFEAQPNAGLAMPYFRRHRGHVVKLAVIYEASSSRCLKVTQASWERAVGTAKRLEETIFHLLPTGMNITGYRISQMEERIRESEDGLLLSQFTRAFQHMERRAREDGLHALCGGGKLIYYKRESERGRPALVLVHEDNLPQYHAAHPNDSVVDG